MLFVLDIREAIAEFFASGGPVLLLIAAITFVLWMMLTERFAYYVRQFPEDLRKVKEVWTSRRDHFSWHADAIRRMYVSELSVKVGRNTGMIKVLIALCPLFGLLGTVTGMIDVFSALALTGGGDAKALAGGVSRATLPTMAGMVAALSGVFGNIYLSRLADRRREMIDETLPRHHHHGAVATGASHGA